MSSLYQQPYEDRLVAGSLRLHQPQGENDSHELCPARTSAIENPRVSLLDWGSKRTEVPSAQLKARDAAEHHDTGCADGTR